MHFFNIFINKIIKIYFFNNYIKKIDDNIKFIKMCNQTHYLNVKKNIFKNHHARFFIFSKNSFFTFLFFDDNMKFLKLRIIKL